MPLVQKIRDKIKTNAFFLGYGLIYWEFKFILHTDPKKSYFLQVKPIEKLSQGDFFNSNLMK